MPFGAGKWYNLSITLNEYTMTIYVENELVSTIELDHNLESEGYLNIQTFNEFFLNTFAVRGAAVWE